MLPSTEPTTTMMVRITARPASSAQSMLDWHALSHHWHWKFWLHAAGDVSSLHTANWSQCVCDWHAPPHTRHAGVSAHAAVAMPAQQSWPNSWHRLCAKHHLHDCVEHAVSLPSGWQVVADDNASRWER